MARAPIARTVVLFAVAMLASCTESGSDILPATSLGRFGKEWLFAHNQGDGHAMVHYTMGNRVTGQMSGAQVDSTVYAGVKFAQEVGPLTPTTLAESSDTSLAILLRSAKGDVWQARFTPAKQPSPVRVRVEVSRVESAPERK
jgi:hypothetical protein